MKRFLLALVLLVGGLAAVYGYQQSQQRKQADAAASDTVAVTRVTLDDIVTAQGKLEPKSYVDVGAQVSGQLKKLYFQIGDTVQKGALVAELDPRVYAARVDADLANLKALQAQLREQEAQVELAEQQLHRTEKLLKKGAVTTDAMEQSETTLKAVSARKDALEAQIEAQRSNLQGDKTNLGYTKIYAPMDGTVVVQDVREGQTLNAVQQTPVIMRIADLAVMTVRAQIAEADVMRLQTGMAVEFSTLGDLDRKWQGRLRQLLPTPEVVNDVVLFNALVDVDNAERLLMSGMSTQLFFIVQRAENVLAIPQGALLRKASAADDDRYVVEVVEGKQRLEKTVSTGVSTRNQVEVVAGLQEGELVVERKISKIRGKPMMMGPRI